MTTETLESVLKRLNQIEKRIDKLEGIDITPPVSNLEDNSLEKQPVVQQNPSQHRIKPSEKARPHR